jgi:outer membrane murein-binding lipoprotein Lpp
MTAETAGQQLTLTCEGTAKREDTELTNDRQYTALSGKVLHLRTDVEGILAENADSAGRLSRLELDVDGIRGQVQAQKTESGQLKTRLTELSQSADSLSARVKSITDNGVSKVVTDFGLSVDGAAVTISRSGSNMENKLSEKGMYVLRDPFTANETVMLRADAAGVLATDVTVRNFLIIGDYARFADYTNGSDSKRTACYWIGG